LILDELGRLESEGRGVWPAACPVLADPRRDSLVVIRQGLLDSFRTRWAGEGVSMRIVSMAETVDPATLLRELTTTIAGPETGFRT